MASHYFFAGIALAILYTAFALFITLKKAYFTPLRHVPGPLYAKFTNLVLKYHVVRGERCQYIHSMHLSYGPFVRISPQEVAISDLHSFRTIHRIGTNFYKSPWYAKFNDTSSPGIFAMTDVKAHAVRRRLFAQQFSNSAILQYEDIVRQHVEMAVSKIERDAKVGNADILKWWTYMATDISSALSFGKSFGMLEQEAKTQYIQDLETTMMISGIKVELPYLVKIAQLLPVRTIQDVMSLPKRLFSYGEAAIANHREMLAQDPGLRSLFGKFLDPAKRQIEISEVDIVTEASNLIVAGSDTTAVSLTYMIWALLKPDNFPVLQKLLKEIAPLPIDASVGSISGLVYLRSVIDETLRLYGAAPGSLPRIVPPGGAYLGKYQVPAGATVSTQAYTLHRDPATFHNPERFWPERWDGPTQQMKDAFSPFGAGSRSCIGIHLALLELQLAVFAFLKRCPSATLAQSTTDDSMDFENYFLIAPRGHRCEITLAR